MVCLVFSYQIDLDYERSFACAIALAFGLHPQGALLIYILFGRLLLPIFHPALICSLGEALASVIVLALKP